MADSNLLTQKKVIELGWTVSMIKKLLPEPISVPNPRYCNAAPMKLWAKDVVLAEMQTERYKEMWGKACKRSETGKKIAAKKAGLLYEEYKNLANCLTIQVLDNDVLIQKTIKAKQSYECEIGRDFTVFYASDIPKETLERWVVNYIRHNLVSYDSSLEVLFGRIGRQKAYEVFKIIILQRISEVYPKYAQECSRQIELVHVE